MEQVALTFLLYILYVLLPLVPAVIIFKMFPSSSVTISGPLSNLTINATGAFAAYVATVILGFWVVTETNERIEEMSMPTWEIATRINLESHDGNKLPMISGLLKDLRVTIEPPLHRKAEPELYLRVPLPKPGDWPNLVLALPGFSETNLNLRTAMEGKGVTREGRTIKVSPAIVLKQLPPVVVEKPYANDQSPLQPLKDQGPPVAQDKQGQP